MPNQPLAPAVTGPVSLQFQHGPLQVLSILFVIDSLGSGGAQRQMVTLAKGLRERGHAVTLVNYYPQIDHFRDELLQSDVRVVDSPKRYRFDLRPIWTVRKLAKESGVDAIVSFLSTPNVYAILGRIGKPFPPLAVSERSMLRTKGLKLKTWLRFQLYRFADTLIVNANHQRRRIALRFPWLSEKTVTVWNGVDLRRFRSHITDYGRSGSALKLVAVGTVQPIKNATNLIRAMDLARRKGQYVTVDWVGRTLPNENSRKEFERCQQLLEELNLKEQWRWLGEQKQVEDLYSNYHGLVHPSYVEGLPNVVCEAMAAGLPILVSRIGDHDELVADGQRGWLFEPEDTADIAEALVKLALLDADDRKKMSVDSRRFAESQLSVERLISEYEKVLYCLTKKSRSKTPTSGSRAA